MSDSLQLPNVQVFLNFNGRCEEALEFYRNTLGATIDSMSRFSESPDADDCGGGGESDKIMHAGFHVGSTAIMASDCGCSGAANFQGFSLALGLVTEAEADRYFNALADGGEIEMPLAKTFWSPRFGVVTDRFGVSWMINVVA